MSEISLGAWITFGDQIDRDTAVGLIRRAFEAGVNYFDNADVYAGGEAERVMGAALRDLPRPALVISSKVFWRSMEGPNGRGLSRKHILESCHASLRRLGVEYLDLYFCHRFDAEVPLEETVRAMDDLVRQGKVLYWGTSEWRARQISSAHRIARAHGWEPPRVEQPEYNLLERRKVEDEIVPVADRLGLGLVTFSPLAMGILSGKYNRGGPQDARLNLPKYAGFRDSLTEGNLGRARALAELAAASGITSAQLAIAWILRLPQVSSVITGATRPSQLEENLGAESAAERLTPDTLRRLEDIFAS